MRRLLALPPLLLLAFALSHVSLAHPVHLGTLVADSGTSVNQGTTSAVFTLPTSSAQKVEIDVQCDAAACVYQGLGSTTGASCAAGASTKGRSIAASEWYPLCLFVAGGSYSAADTVAAISVSGLAHCEVYWEPTSMWCF